MSDESQRTKTDITFWNEKWALNQIGFHMSDLHPMLVKHIEKLTENRTQLRFFFPLCGKAVDMKWLANQGNIIVGVESVQSAIEQFFNESNLNYQIKEANGFKVYHTEDNRIRLYQGDYFKFSTELEEKFDCIWDRGSLVAIPIFLRDKYVEVTLSLLKPDFKYLLDTFEYPPETYPGPPHTIPIEEVQRLYGSKCSVEKIDTAFYHPFSEKQKENPPKECVYYLKPL